MAEPSLQSCDLLFQGADVIDGTGAPARRADVAVVGERIAAIGDLSSVDAKETVDARGRVVAPGFIDVHTHDDRAVLSAPDMTPKISQGVTTVIAGNCGVSLAPLVLDRPPPPPLNLIGDSSWFRFPSVRAYRQEVEADPAAVNVALLVGHSSLRVQVMDDLTRPASPTEIDEMADLVDEAMESGCLGLSTGLAYPPAIAAPTQEVIALAGRVARLGGLYATHMRNERGGVVASVEGKRSFRPWNGSRQAHLPR